MRPPAYRRVSGVQTDPIWLTRFARSFNTSHACWVTRLWLSDILLSLRDNRAFYNSLASSERFNIIHTTYLRHQYLIYGHNFNLCAQLEKSIWRKAIALYLSKIYSNDCGQNKRSVHLTDFHIQWEQIIRQEPRYLCSLFEFHCFMMEQRFLQTHYWRLAKYIYEKKTLVDTLSIADLASEQVLTIYLHLLQRVFKRLLDKNRTFTALIVC